MNRKRASRQNEHSRIVNNNSSGIVCKYPVYNKRDKSTYNIRNTRARRYISQCGIRIANFSQTMGMSGKYSSKNKRDGIDKYIYSP